MDTFGKILLIDDNQDVLFSLKYLLEPYCRQIETAISPSEALEKGTSFCPDVWLADMNFRIAAQSGQEGFRLLDEILAWDRDAVVVLMTAYSDTDKAVKAIKAGATDFVSKPWDKDRLLATLGAAFHARELKIEAKTLKKETQSLKKETQSLKKEAKSLKSEAQSLKNEAQSLKNEVQDLSQKVQVLAAPTPSQQSIIGDSPAMKEVMDWVEKLESTDANVLITGENGTGKDLLAQELHRRSERSIKPLISIDLGAIPESLFESELFGYEKGAFTDARALKLGRIEVANSGTLFLNEVGNLTLPMQAKLLQVLETRTVQRLGAVRPISIDVRLICATNRDLSSAVAQGSFREDLLYRINTVEIQLPALRLRGNDILLLANHFLSVYAAKYRKNVRQLSHPAQTLLLQYSWPGNVRELQHVMERAVIFAKGQSVAAEELLLRPTGNSGKNEKELMNLDEVERQTITKALEAAKGNMNQAASLLGITRFALYRKIEKYGL